jgi:hypothetical protein
MKYQIKIIVSPIIGSGREYMEVAFKGGKQRLQNLFKSICWMLEHEPQLTQKGNGRSPKKSQKKSQGCICDPKRRPDQLRINPYCRAQHAG